MKERRLVLTLEVDSNAKLSTLRKVRGAHLFKPGVAGAIVVKIVQASANVIQAEAAPATKPPRKRP